MTFLSITAPSVGPLHLSCLLNLLCHLLSYNWSLLSSHRVFRVSWFTCQDTISCLELVLPYSSGKNDYNCSAVTACSMTTFSQSWNNSPWHDPYYSLLHHNQIKTYRKAFRSRFNVNLYLSHADNSRSCSCYQTIFQSRTVCPNTQSWSDLRYWNRVRTVLWLKRCWWDTNKWQMKRLRDWGRRQNAVGRERLEKEGCLRRRKKELMKEVKWRDTEIKEEWEGTKKPKIGSSVVFCCTQQICQLRETFHLRTGHCGTGREIAFKRS